MKIFYPIVLFFRRLYNNYIYYPSSHWKATAKHMRRLAFYTCQDCGRTDRPLDVHHLSYKRLGHERPEDLRVLCRECHNKRHNVDVNKMV